VEQVTGQKK